MEKMTKKAAYMLAIEALNSGDYSDSKEQAIEVLTKEISRLNAVSAKATVKRATKAEAKAADLIARINEVFTANDGQALSAAEITALIDNDEITKSKVSYRLGRMAKDNLLAKETITSKDAEGKAHRMTVYSRV